MHANTKSISRDARGIDAMRELREEVVESEGESEGDGGGWLCVSDITCSMHGVHPGSFTFSLVDAYIYHEYLKKIFAVDAVCVQRAVTLSRQWTQTASKAAERVKTN